MKFVITEQRRNRGRAQAQHICLRVGLRALLTWAKLSKQRRVGRHRAFTHAMLRLKRVALEAWESVVYPMGRPRSVPSRICKEEDKLTEWGEKQLPTGAASEQTVGCLETAMVKAVEIRSLQYPPNSLRTLRLPMVRTLLRRVLRSWGKNAAKEKRIRYIEKMLQASVPCFPDKCCREDFERLGDFARAPIS